MNGHDYDRLLRRDRRQAERLWWTAVVVWIAFVVVLLSGCATPRQMRCMFDWETGVINCAPVVEEIPAEPRILGAK